MIELTDTHCHIHFPDYVIDPEEAISNAHEAGVNKLLCVGCTLEDSQAAVNLTERHDNVWASIGLHPHEAKHYVHSTQKLQKFCNLLVENSKIVAIGECGLDYYYEHSPREDQKKLLRYQLDLAFSHNLPLIFHVRDAYDDFWEIYDEYINRGHKLSGVVHSFSAGPAEVQQILERGLYIGLNGIMTFTKDPRQTEAVKSIPLEKLLLETDAPFLTPEPFRGTICEPKHVRVTAEFLSNLRGETLEALAIATTRSAKALFNL